ncbi:CPBP family intramembrane glutamic endopeptidase [Staphylococcus felis]|uniref:CPBP family intramembrane glutamic endopeptidase n=1 Tax=Staphylococcus felis TaxID=46127 RepID=UPI000E222ED5|nr:type II CAAX endopeptidase family protein [Staphylococcus felis]REH76320.1 CPBP family intramembrane metalloprotease [Staphylococcus felis]REH98079.1 CPBP family intramembrane metalloprotease [Staphylococcus felis]REI03227.1 CPBP family intramembrane metalloprotease [Staphylococcus felis]REI09301.1 CPBP family intramembrane metalloprotease [Staphylococcus felis]REI26926.1 CPBP family intramembrane metalloprotease [Staphylococcus felis]
MQRFHSDKVAWRDLWAFLVYVIVSVFLIPFIFHLFRPSSQSLSSPLILNMMGIMTALAVISYLAWSHRHQLREQIKVHLKYLKGSFKLIILAYILYMVANAITTALMNFLPEQWQFTNTGNQEAIKILFEDPKILPVVFINIAILTPIMEELLFRHIIIGELGKKLGFIVMGVVSIIFFAGMHLILAVSPFEAIPYLLMATMFVVIYIKSGRNIAVSIASHMLVNTVAFIALVVQSYS